jgi:hypothetical protein
MQNLPEFQNGFSKSNEQAIRLEKTKRPPGLMGQAFPLEN